ncbi:MAG: hypothetical protein J6Z79_04040 [Clostridia bacterium]|nr:hypothetical protein [Clostridia bacterium]
MGLWDYIIIGVIAAAVIAAVIYVRKGKSRCSCGCDGCPSCDTCKKKPKK